MPIANTCSIGYPHDGRADNAAYRHDRRADNAAYRHDRRADSLSRRGKVKEQGREIRIGRIQICIRVISVWWWALILSLRSGEGVAEGPELMG